MPEVRLGVPFLAVVVRKIAVAPTGNQRLSSNSICALFDGSLLITYTNVTSSNLFEYALGETGNRRGTRHNCNAYCLQRRYGNSQEQSSSWAITTIGCI
jgi:hypothetical protein